MHALAITPIGWGLPMSDNTDRLLKEFLEGQRRDEKTRFDQGESVKQAVKSLANSIDQKLEVFTRDIRGELKKTNSRVEEIGHLAKGAHARLDNLQAKRENVHTAKSMIYEMGEESPTGSWKISKEVLEQYDLAKDGNTWRWLKANGTKIGVTVISTLLAAVLAAKILGAAGIHIL